MVRLLSASVQMSCYCSVSVMCDVIEMTLEPGKDSVFSLLYVLNFASIASDYVN